MNTIINLHHANMHVCITYCSLSKFLPRNTYLTRLYGVIYDASSRKSSPKPIYIGVHGQRRHFRPSHLAACGNCGDSPVSNLVPLYVNSNTTLSPALYTIRALFNIRTRSRFLTITALYALQQQLTSHTVAVKLLPTKSMEVKDKVRDGVLGLEQLALCVETLESRIRRSWAPI